MHTVFCLITFSDNFELLPLVSLIKFLKKINVTFIRNDKSYQLNCILKCVIVTET